MKFTNEQFDQLEEQLEDTFLNIESLLYNTNVNVLSNLEQLKRVVRQDVSYSILRSFMGGYEWAEQRIRNRLVWLWTEGATAHILEHEYANEDDIAFFVYILVLQDHTEDVFKECGRMVITPKLWWTKKLINEFMNPKLF